ncbi:12021_t:CDS:2 [Rhizophagus irregularis]|nr:12021_t:CDS:2 [Rhizophagus irregularis]
MDKVKNKQKTTASTSSIIKQLTKDSPDITYVPYSSELQLPGIMSLIENDLSEPYSIYTYPMLAVKKEYRKRKIGTTLVKIVINAMKLKNADEIVLETEYTNLGALSLYHNLGFIRDKRLYRYYLNGVDAFRLKLFCKSEIQIPIVEVSNRAICEETKKKLKFESLLVFIMNQFSSYITEITETTTNVEIVNSSIEVQQQKESSNTSPTQTSSDNNYLPPPSSLPSPTNTINNNDTDYDKVPIYTCHEIGPCVPCGVFEVKLEKYCHEFGNKQPVECQLDSPDISAGNNTYSLPKFQPCKRVIKFERTKYFEFQFLNMFLAFMSCSILIWRRSKLAADGYRKLSRRIRGNTL